MGRRPTLRPLWALDPNVPQTQAVNTDNEENRVATTLIPEWPTNLPTLTDDMVEAIKDWYETAQGDEDKAGDVDDCAFYEGQRLAFGSVLALLYGIEDLSTLGRVMPTRWQSQPPYTKP